MATARKSIQQRLEAVLAALPPKKLEQVVDFAEYLTSREEWEATLELMNDPAMREDVDEGRAQAARGEGRPWRPKSRSQTPAPFPETPRRSPAGTPGRVRP
jgi:hypothetical protein